MPSLLGLLKNNDRARSEGIIRFNAPFHCFRTSKAINESLQSLAKHLVFPLGFCSFHMLNINIFSRVLGFPVLPL